MKTIMLALFLSVNASAAVTTTTQDPDYTNRLYKNILPACGATNVSYSCQGDDCTIKWTEPATPCSFVDKRANQLARNAEQDGLEAKLDDGTITNAELRRLVKILLLRLKYSKDN